MSNENLSDAIAALQEAQAALVAEHEHIETHNIDTEAHADIRELIDRIMDSEEIYSNTQIRAIINSLLDEHARTDFKTAHPGWSTFANQLTESLSSLRADITTIQNRLDARDDAQTDLAERLAIVESKYAPILDNLTKELITAQNAGDQLLADSYKETIRLQLKNKADEELEVIAAWQAEHN
jgi:hypothetical protein